MAIEQFVSNDRQARDVEQSLAELDDALSSEQILKSIVEGLPYQVAEGVRRSLTVERDALSGLLSAYHGAKGGDFSLFRDKIGSDPGAFLILARLMRKLTQKELARKLGLREQAIQRWEAERYRTISLSNYQKIAAVLGVRWQLTEFSHLEQQFKPSFDVSRDDLMKVVRHARANGWFDLEEKSEEKEISKLVQHVGDHVARYGTPSLLRTGLNVKDKSNDWSLLSWKAQVTRRAEKIIAETKLNYRPRRVSWLMELIQLSRMENGAHAARDILLKNGIVLVCERQIPGMSVDGAAFLVEDIPVIGMTLLRDSVDNFWFTLAHEIAHIILHYRTGLTSGFFDDTTNAKIDDMEAEANLFAENLLIPSEIWARSPARISKTAEPVEKLAEQLSINSAIIFGRIRKEREDYKIFSNKIGRGTVRKQFFSSSEGEE